MADKYFFDKEDSQRIANAVPWVEQRMKAGNTSLAYDKLNTSKTYYVRLTEQDAGGPGLWSAVEVANNEGVWTTLNNGKVWDGSDFSYIRHYSNSGATVDQVVKAFLIKDRTTGATVWVFDTDLGNPEVFQFYSDDNGSSSECKDLAKVWKMPEAGKVMTNVGTLQVAEPFELNPGMMCVCVCRFVDFGYGLELASADLIERPLGDPGTYWDNSSAGEIFVRIPIASVSTAAGVARLEQHHAGDIRIEMFTHAKDEDDDDIRPYNEPISVQDGQPWINVDQLGNTFTVTHTLPVHPANELNSFKALDDAFNCDPVNFSSVSDVTDWVNNTLLANIKKLIYDERGHIYKREDCDGNVEEYTPTEEPTEERLTSTLSETAASRVVPEDVSSTFAFDFVYKIFNKGLNFTDYIASGKLINLGITNGLGEKVRYNYVSGGPYASIVRNPAENVDGTSGLDKDVNLGTNFFRFNDVFYLTCGVPGKAALAKNATINSETCTATLNTTTTIIRDKTDPNAAAFSVSVTYSVTNLGSATVPTISDTLTNGPYCTGLYFKYSDGQRVSWSYQGANGPFSTDTRFLELDNTSQTGVFSNIYFDLRDDVTDDVDFDLVESGVIVDMCTELLATDSLYNANVDQCEVLSVLTESDCINDGIDDVTDDSGFCIVGGELPLTANLSGSQSFDCGDPSNLRITGDITLASWVKFDTLGSSRGIITKYDSSGNERSYGIAYVGGSNRIEFFVDGDGLGTTEFNSVKADSLGAPSAGTWYHVAATLSGNSIRIYINGSLDNSGTHTFGIHPGTADVSVGSYHNNTGALDGGIAFAGIWNRALNASEIANLYLGTATGTCYDRLNINSPGITSGLVSYWHLAKFIGHEDDQLKDQQGANDVSENSGPVAYNGTDLSVDCG